MGHDEFSSTGWSTADESAGPDQTGARQTCRYHALRACRGHIRSALWSRVTALPGTRVALSGHDISMGERRRGERQMLAQPGMGTVSVVQDVEITHLDAIESVVIASRTIPHGERLLLTMPDTSGGESHTRLASATSSRVVLRDGALRREVRLAISPRPGDSRDAVEQFATLAQRKGTVGGALMRRVPVRIVQVSTSGCLWESPSSFDEGTVGFIYLRAAGQHHSEAVRVLRTIRSAITRWPYQMAVEFLTLGPLSPDSLRGVAALVAVGTPLSSRP